MRRTITISVSEEMHGLIRKGMRSNYYSTVSEYIRYLVRRDQPIETSQVKNRNDEPRRINDIAKDVLREIEAERQSRVLHRRDLDL